MVSRSMGVSGRQASNGYASTRPVVLGLAKMLVMGLGQLSMTNAAPLKTLLHLADEESSADEPSLWIYLSTALMLVLLGGAFAGLTIA